MAGKYAKFRGKYPNYVAPDKAKYQAKINLVRVNEVEGKEPEIIGKEYDDLRLKKDKIEEELSDLNIEIFAREQCLADLLETRNIEKIVLANGTSLSIKDTPVGTEEERPRFIQWVRDEKMTGMFSVHWQRLQSLVCERLSKGQPAPPGIKVWMKKGLNWRNPNRHHQGEENGEE